MVTSKTPVIQSFTVEGVDHISPENAYVELLNGTAIMIDVREDDEFMIEFVNLNDVCQFPMSSILDKMQNIPDDKPVIVLCRNGVRSAKVANLLVRNGFVNPVNLDGGIVAWKEKGLPYETILPDACTGCHGSCSSCSH